MYDTATYIQQIFHNYADNNNNNNNIWIITNVNLKGITKVLSEGGTYSRTNHN